MPKRKTESETDFGSVDINDAFKVLDDLNPNAALNPLFNLNSAFTIYFIIFSFFH